MVHRDVTITNLLIQQTLSLKLIVRELISDLDKGEELAKELDKDEAKASKSAQLINYSFLDITDFLNRMVCGFQK